MQFRIVLAALLWIVGVAAQTTPKKDHTLGYDDTPYLPDIKWRVHDVNRPRPPVVAPGNESGGPPSDAIVLFDGTDLSQWVNPAKGEPAPKSKLDNGCLLSGVMTKEKFGDIQLHLEWASLAEVSGKGQLRGNSGVILMRRYEIQILDSYENPTYADGQAAAIYGQWPPLVNASRKPGEWQTFDMVFEAPRFEGDKVTKPAYVTLFHNGVLVHHRQRLIGRVAHERVGAYTPHDPEEPLLLQQHGEPLRFRNIWVRRLKFTRRSKRIPE